MSDRIARLIFDPQTQTVRVAHGANWRLPERYDFESAPYYEWRAGASLWSKLHAGQPLKLPLAAAADPIWVGLKFLHTFTKA